MKHKYMSAKEAQIARIAALIAGYALATIGLGTLFFILVKISEELISTTGARLLLLILAASGLLCLIIGMYIAGEVRALYVPARHFLIEGLGELTLAEEKNNFKEALENGCVVTVRDVIFLNRIHDEAHKRLETIETLKAKLSR